MAGVEAWQHSGRRDFESDSVQHDSQEFAAMPLQPEFAVVGSAPLYDHVYQIHGTFSRTDTMNSNPDSQSVYVDVPAYTPIRDYGTYGGALTDQSFAMEGNPVSWSSESNACNTMTTNNDGFQNVPFSSAGPTLEAYAQNTAHSFAILDPMDAASSQGLQDNQGAAFLLFDSSSTQQAEAPFSGISAPPTEAGSSVQYGWGLTSPYASTSNSSNSDWVLPSYEADTVKSRPSSRNSNAVKPTSPSSESKVSDSPKNQMPVVGETRAGAQKPAKISPHTPERAHKSKVSKRKGKLNPEQRSKAAEMRKAGRCLRCALYKLGCDLGEPCNNCSRILNSPRSFRQPCLRADLKSIKLVRQCNGRFGQETASFRKYRWVLEDTPSKMEIKWVLPGNVPIAVCKMNVPFKRYLPEPGDIIDTTAFHYNLNGRIGRIDLPPYAVSDTTELMNTVDDFLVKAQPEVECWVRNRFQNDPLKSATFSEACRYRKQYGSSLIAKAIQMQCGAIMSQGSGSVLNCPDIELIDYRQFGYSCYEAYNRGPDRPLPQAVGHQFDVALLLKINEWQKDFLRELKSKVFMSGAKPWYEIFLACFVLLSNLEYIYGGALAYAQTKLRTRLENQVSSVVRQQIAKWDSGARILLLYFRCVAKGHIPFVTQSLDPASLKAGGFDDDTVQYLGKIVQLLRLEGGKAIISVTRNPPADMRAAREPNYSLSPSTDAPAPCGWSRLLFSEDPVP